MPSQQSKSVKNCTVEAGNTEDDEERMERKD